MAKQDKKEASTVIKQNEKLNSWEEKLHHALNFYQGTIAEMNDNYDAYTGDRDIVNSNGTKATKKKTSVRKVTFELVESQVDTNIPQPKVTSVKGNYNRAQTIEYFLKNELDRLPFEEINDEQERTTKIAGGALFLTEWDNAIKTRNTIGKLNVKSIHPSEIIPQPGVFKLQEMDYWFMQLLQSKRYIKERYGVDVSEEGNDKPEKDPTSNEDLVTHNFAYYKNEDGYISLYSWVGKTEIQDIDNYFARKVKICKKCETQLLGTDTCSKCGHDKFELKTLEKEKLMIPGMKMNEITGQEEMGEIEIEIPYYVPKLFPLVIRKNASEVGSLMGNADVTAIKDQQNDLNIYTTKIREKLLKGGSVVTIPDDVAFKASDDELKIVKIKTPNQKALFDVISLQPNVSNDLQLLQMTYEIARQTIGITDSFQGRKDTTAVSGKAKEFAAQQTAGRLDSKRAMKNFAYSQQYEVMFQFMLAYADEPRYYHFQDDQGQLQYKMFDKRMFIDQDAAGNYYYDDEFIFACDESAILSTNRRAMWEETRLNFTSGAYGNPTDPQTLAMFWQMMDTLHYPGAKQALQFANERIKLQQEQMAQQQAMQQAEAERGQAIEAFGQINKAKQARQQAQAKTVV